MLFGFVDLHTTYIIFHLLGVVLGAGGAFVSDAMFLLSIKDGKIFKTEMRFLKLGSSIVWIGLIILIVSGALLFSEDTERYLNSSKFLAKMTIVGIIIINGFVFHRYHIPFLNRRIDASLRSSKIFLKRLPLLMVSGVISMVSWLSALTLGVFKAVPYSYAEIMMLYMFILAAAIIFSFLIRKHLSDFAD